MEHSYWIWHDGDYEIYHLLKLHLRREEYGLMRPPFWKQATPYPTVKFRKQITCDKGYLICTINGQGHVSVDGKRYRTGEKVWITKGEHMIEIHAGKIGGLPAAFVESDVCPSDGSWLCNHFAGEWLPVGCLPYFDSIEKTPEVFPFSYERKIPASVQRMDGGFLYDFGTELFGILNISDADPQKKIDLFYGESREEALDTDSSYITDSICGEEEYHLKPRAFRYVYILSSADTLTVSADYEYLPLKRVGSFHCDDSVFNEIVAASAYTFHLNCREGFLDGIKRDRWVWAGDTYQSARINRYLFADKEVDQRTLRGLIGKEPIEQHINTILDYSLLWIISLYEHYMTYADRVFLEKIFPMAQKLLAFCETRLNQDGFLEGIGDDWIFVDWSEIEKVGAVCAEQMLLIQVYAVMGELSNVLGRAESEYTEKENALKKRVNAFYWDIEKGAFIDSYVSGNQHVSRHANIFAIMYGIASEAQTNSILKNVLKNDAITKITTPYFEGYELDALAKLGQYEAVEAMLHSYWGGMMRLGAKTIWEEYHPEMQGAEHYAMYDGKYEKSLCHAWGAGPIYLFGRYYLGVYATKPGYETFSVEPNLGGLNEISGTVPVNGGVVTVELNKKRLYVMATKPGGTLVWDGNQYPLHPNHAIELEVFSEKR